MTRSAAVTILTGLLALLGAAGIALPIAATTDPDALDLPEIVDAAAVIGAALGSLYAAWRTWRGNTVLPRPPGEVVPPAQLAVLRGKAAAHDAKVELRRQAGWAFVPPPPGVLEPNEVLQQAPPQPVERYSPFAGGTTWFSRCLCLAVPATALASILHGAAP